MEQLTFSQGVNDKMKGKLLFSVTKRDMDIDYFSGTGPGGQKRNKTQNCVRIRHRESGAIVTGQSNKSRLANEKEALKNLVSNPKFRLWYARRIHEIISEETIEERVDEAMSDENIKIEVFEYNEWRLINAKDSL